MTAHMNTEGAITHYTQNRLTPSKAHATMMAELKRISKNQSLIARNAEVDPRPVREVIASSLLFNLYF